MLRAAARRPINGPNAARISSNSTRKSGPSLRTSASTTAGWVSPSGSRTTLPLPCRTSIRPICCSRARPWRSEVRLTPSRSARSRSGGRVEPGGKTPSRMASAIVVAIRSSTRCRSGG
ncbi:Uncharacterised protein [Mycobacterium tuberculosis]|uniref:Uncharacterized protein n=1 Tax=Mycobacterium tuberculosis TaxID=1773 RepID=A0A916PAY3_MYCTX|nr:Uncharacterised protein [Mycobacterium tuberculosis]COX40664.1 Uncharacterised protein [Mycobacterium tuberculosis]